MLMLTFGLLATALLSDKRK
ncbi:hypothetical protein [Paenibacillus barcinonensis]